MFSMMRTQRIALTAAGTWFLTIAPRPKPMIAHAIPTATSPNAGAASLATRIVMSPPLSAAGPYAPKATPISAAVAVMAAGSGHTRGARPPRVAGRGRSDRGGGGALQRLRYPVHRRGAAPHLLAFLLVKKASVEGRRMAGIALRQWCGAGPSGP